MQPDRTGDGLVEFLRARLAEDELAAQAATHYAMIRVESHTKAEEDHARRHGPARVLADIAAKRAILDFLDPAGMPEGEGRYVAVKVLCLLGTAYADRPGYDEAWRP